MVSYVEIINVLYVECKWEENNIQQCEINETET